MSPVDSAIFEAPSINTTGAIRMVSSANNESDSLPSARYANERYMHKDVSVELCRLPRKMTD